MSREAHYVMIIVVLFPLVFLSAVLVVACSQGSPPADPASEPECVEGYMVFGHDFSSRAEPCSYYDGTTPEFVGFDSHLVVHCVCPREEP